MMAKIYTNNSNVSLIRKIFNVVVGSIFLMAALQPANAELPSEKWVADNNGCKAFKPFPTYEDNISWSGKCINGYVDGNGVLTWLHSDGPADVIYKGNFVKGKMEGFGSVKFYGHTTQGNFAGSMSVDGKRVIEYIDGGSYKGDIIKGKFQGKGIQKLPNGDIYEGDFVDSRFQGNGVLTSLDGSKVEGDWKAGDPFNSKKIDSSGNVIQIWVNGNVTQQANVKNAANDSSAASSSGGVSPELTQLMDGVLGIVAQNKINHDAKRQRQAVAQQQAQQLADQQAQAEQQAYDNSRAQLDAQRAREIQANTESMNSFHAGTATNSTLASNNNTRNAANNSSSNSARTSTPARKPPQAPCTSTSTYNDRKGIPYSDLFMRGNTIFAKVIPNTSYGADCSISFTLNGNSRTLYLNNIPGNTYSEALVGNYAESMSVQWDNIYSTCQLSSFERDRRETVRKQEIFKCQVDRR